MKIIVFVNSCK